MKFILFLVLGTILSFGDATPVVEGKDTGKIKQEQDKEIVLNSGQFSYVVHLEIRKAKKLENSKNLLLRISNCGGVIIRPNVVLTAAHCIGDVNLKPKIFAWAGIVDTKKQEGQGQRIPVKYYKQHEKYVAGLLYGIYNPNDIAILWLEKPFIYDGKYITQAILPEGKLKVENKRGWIVGWGLTQCGEVSSMLQKATLRALSQQECEPYFTPPIITDKVICVISDKQNSISAKGDSGGPFVVQGKVVGLSSFGAKLTVKNKKGEDVDSCNPKKPGVYTDVFKYIDWINKKLEDGPLVQSPKIKSKL